MSAVYDYDNNNFAPQGYYGRVQPYGYSTRNYSSNVVPAYQTAPAGFSYSHHHHAHHQAPFYPTIAAVPTTAADVAAPIPVLAERYKTKYCKNYVQYQNCPYEERCMFAHGDEELRSVDENVRDGLITDEAIKAFQRQWRQAMHYQHQQHYDAEEPTVDVAEEQDETMSTATVPKTIHQYGYEQDGGYGENNSEMPVREFLAPNVYRYNPYGTLGGPVVEATTIVKKQQPALVSVSRSSSVDNMSSVGGDEQWDHECGWSEEATPQKRPLMAM